MRLWRVDTEVNPVEVDDKELADRFLADGYGEASKENPDMKINELLRAWLNLQGYIYEENEFEFLYDTVLMECVKHGY